MAKFKIIKKGKNENGTFWFLIANDNDGFIETGIVKKSADVTTKELDVPDKLVDKINWKL
jgi:hypothetical protein